MVSAVFFCVSKSFPVMFQIICYFLSKFLQSFATLFYTNYKLLLCYYCFEGDNFFKSASYTIEAICAETYLETSVKLKEIEAQILAKRNELRQFETEYREVSHYKFQYL